MTDQPDHKTFDLLEVLAGRAYPTREVPIYFNEDIGLRAFDLKRKMEKVSGDEYEETLKEYEALQKDAKPQQFTVHLRGIDDSIRRDVALAVSEEFPPKTDLTGRQTPHPRWDEEYTARMWRLYIIKIEDPSGAIALLDEASVNALLEKAPRSAYEEINNGIAELQVGPAAGFEQMVKDTSFLFDASPEG